MDSQGIVGMTDILSISKKLSDIEAVKSFLDGLFAHTPVGFGVVQSNGQTLVVNQDFMDLFGSVPSSGFNLFEDKRAEALGLITLIRQSFAGEILHTPVNWYEADEVRGCQVERKALSMSSFPLCDAQGQIQYVVVSCRDHTAEALACEKLEAERARLEEQLRQAQKIEVIGRLAGSVAHDFNNLLTVINGYSELLLADLPADTGWTEAMQQIHQAGQQAAALTTQLLAFGRKSILNPVQLDLNPVVLKLEKMFQRLLREDIEISLKLDSGLEAVLIDPSQLEQIVMNLVLNARDAMPNGGTLLIETANVLSDQSDNLPAGRYVLLAVSDNGIGMDEGTRQRIFEPFYTTKVEGQGTGLGLSTVHEIVSQNGAHILVESQPVQGTSIRIYFPSRGLPADRR